ncbi:hypothetical protein ACFSX5_14630 [Devosia albogilva]|uniref:Uncharacterized protein n=1 Tax=Devosia albogilva TaxID=429726 RepID=A0ABW5QNH1_9HYPH
MARPFAGLLEPVIVEELPASPLPGALARQHVEAAWTWVLRDLAPDLLSAERAANGSLTAAELEDVATELLARMKDQLARAEADFDTGRRLRAMLGSDEARAALPAVVAALRHRALLTKAQGFGRAVNAISEEAGLVAALQSMPVQDPALAGLLFLAAAGQVANPSRLVLAVIKICGNPSEATIIRSGFAPLIDGLLTQAQNQLHLMKPMGPFADIDLTCRGLDRFHRLVRAVTGYVELTRGGRWTAALSAMTRQVSERIEPRLKTVVTDLNMAMRRGRDGSDRLDNSAVLAAIGGVYLLAAVRECRDSLAVNATFDQAWSQTGQALETHLERNLDLLRRQPGDPVVGGRLDAAIKMAEVRFNADYADTLRRARASAERRS